ncbi:MAG TPA: META domain-containing protein [Longimicrobiales bacterium]|nr:META domain-containing protein [Longimicrobiales bacterium]
MTARVALTLVLLAAPACSGGESSGAAESREAPPADSASLLASVEGIQLLRGMMTYLADAPRFTDCATGLSAVLAQEADYLAAERAYLDAGAQGEPLLVTFEGRWTRRPALEGGEVDAVVIVGFGGAEPGHGCGADPIPGRLEGTEWRLVSLPGAADVPSGAEATLLLDPDTRRSSGSTGCNRFGGGYALEGGRLTLGLSTLTRMACPGPLAALEADFLEALRVAGGYRFVGEFLELLGEAGPVARFGPRAQR